MHGRTPGLVPPFLFIGDSFRDDPAGLRSTGGGLSYRPFASQRRKHCGYSGGTGRLQRSLELAHGRSEGSRIKGLG